MTAAKIKKAKRTKEFVIKRKLKYEDFKNCLKLTQLKNKINHLDKNEIDAHNQNVHHKKFIKKKKISITNIAKIRMGKKNTKMINFDVTKERKLDWL